MGEEGEEEEEEEEEGAADNELLTGGGGGASSAAHPKPGVIPYEGRRGLGGSAAAGLASKARRRKREAPAKAKSRSWIIAKKEAQRKRGVVTRPDTKYTARKRKPKF